MTSVPLPLMLTLIAGLRGWLPGLLTVKWLFFPLSLVLAIKLVLVLHLSPNLHFCMNFFMFIYF